jgi:hypothetical protein
MPGFIWFVLGLAVLPVGFGAAVLGEKVLMVIRHAYTRPIKFTDKTLAWRRSLIVGLTLELLDATHVRAIRLPFNRVFIIRSNPRKQYDFVGQSWVAIGADFQNAEQLIGHALDQLGYELPAETDADG